MEALEWEILLDGLQSGKCILCLGPDLYSLSGDDRLEHRLAKTLGDHQDELGIRVYDDGWFHYLNQRDEMSTYYLIKRFYENQLPSSADQILAKIAALPFNLILNFSPGHKVKACYEEVRGKGKFSYDKLLKNPGDIADIVHELEADSNKPLVYNMLGDIDYKDSLVMTYDDLFNFMEAIFEHKRMPESIKNWLLKANYFIFLGMPLDKWYFHLFMRLLNQHLNKGRTKRYSASTWFDADSATFSEEQYTMTFVQEGIEHFVDQLTGHWEKRHQEHAQQEQGSVFNRWRELLTTGWAKVIDVIREIKSFVASTPDMSTNITLLEYKWNAVNSKTFETEKAEEARQTEVVLAVLNMINQLEQST